MYQRPEPMIPDGYSGTALRREPEPCPPPPRVDETGDLLLLVLLLLVIGENGESDKLLALILAVLLCAPRGGER